MLVKLYALPLMDSKFRQLEASGITVRQPMAYERQSLIQWVSKNFNALWAEECATAFGGHPIGCRIAVHEGALAGFCCVNVTYKNFVGPIGVLSQLRGQGVGRAVLRSALNVLRHEGCAYAIIGDAGEPAFFEKAAGAVEIAGSKPGAYPPKLK